MKNLFILLVIVLAGCNNVIGEEGEKTSQDSIATDTASNVDKLNDVINQNRQADDSIKNIENIEQQLKDTPK